MLTDSLRSLLQKASKNSRLPSDKKGVAGLCTLIRVAKNEERNMEYVIVSSFGTEEAN